MLKEYEFHPIANVFPLMSNIEMAEFTKNIREIGLQEPGLLFEDKILDGRNRYLACREIGVEFTASVYHGDNPIAKVVSLNLHRRHLTDSQRAVVASDIAKLRHGHNRWSKLDLSIDSSTIPQLEAAKLMNVGVGTVRRARRVEKEAPELMEKIKNGAMSVNGAMGQLHPDTYYSGNERRKKQTKQIAAHVDLGHHVYACIPPILKEVRINKEQRRTIDAIERYFKTRRDQRILITYLR